MLFTTVRSKEKDYDIYLKSEKLLHSQQEHEKIFSPAIWKWKKLVPSYFEPDKHCCSYLEREKSGNLLFGYLIIKINERTIIIKKIINGVNAMDAFLTNYNNTGPPGIDPSTAKQLPLATATLNRWRRNNADLELPDTLLSCRPSSIKKENDCVPHRPSVSTATGEKKWPRRQAYFALFKVRKKGSQQLGARKKCFPYILKGKKLVPSYFEPEKHCRSYLEREKSGYLLFGD